MPKVQRPYIVAMTAHALTGDYEKCINAGMENYISKPIRLDKLVGALEQGQKSLAGKQIEKEERVISFRL